MRWKSKCQTISICLVSLLCGALLYHLLTEQYYRLKELESSRVVGSNKRSVKKYKQKFPVSDSFRFPQPHYSRPDSVLLQSEWNMHLQDYLKTVKGKQISLVTSTQEHIDVVMNWLISAYLIAKPPLENVLVLSMGPKLHRILQNHGFSSLYVSADWVTSPRAHIERVFSQVHIVRMNVLRLLNHYGFDVVNYDCDAILLKNPQKLFDSAHRADIIGTFGKGPASLFTKWGVTLNTGVMVLRANPQVEFFWEQMSKLQWSTTDDQGMINLALDSLKIRWIDFKKSDNIDERKRDIQGYVKLSNPEFKMLVSLLSFERVCRHTCAPEKREDYFVWHALAIKENRTVDNKMSQARLGGAWFLDQQWDSLSNSESSLKLDSWLKLIANF